MSNENALIGFIVGMGAALYIILLVLCVLLIIAQWKIFTKAGEAGWKSLIPIYSTYILFKVIYGNGWKFLFLLVPIIDIVFGIAMWIRLAQAFGKDIVFGILTLFFPNICTLILGFGSAQYQGPTDSFV